MSNGFGLNDLMNNLNRNSSSQENDELKRVLGQIKQGPGERIELPEEQKAETKKNIAQLAGVPEKALTEKNILGAKQAAEGAVQVQAQGVDPSRVPASQLKEIATGEPDRDSEKDKTMQALVARSLIAFAPILAGAAFGGSTGGAIGAQAGLTGLQTLETAEKEEREILAKLKAKQEERAFEKEKQLFARETELGKVILNRQTEFEKQKKEIQAKFDIEKLKEKGDKSKIAADLRKERSGLGITKNTVQMSENFGKIKSNAEAGTPAGDIALVFNFMKMLDPGSTVREGEQAQVRNAAAVPDQWRNLYNRALTGQNLNPEQRADILQRSQALMENQNKLQSDIDSQFVRIAQQTGLNPEDIILRTPGLEPEQQRKLSREEFEKLSPEDQERYLAEQESRIAKRR